MQTPTATDEATQALIANAIRTETTAAGVSVAQIVLFGSRARGDADPHSDWDILIILDHPICPQERMELFSRLNRALASRLIPCDLIIRSKQEVLHERQRIGSVVRTALTEGKAL
ncbi:MAG: nucleotidyltransferase domain-containing protein [Fimbriimonadales bacterium]